MAITYETTVRIRIIGITLSIVPLLLIFFKPFDFVTNTLLVYGLLIVSAIVMVIGQAIVLSIAPNEETDTKHQRHEVIYDIVSTSLVVILFAAFYAIPFITKHIS